MRYLDLTQPESAGDCHRTHEGIQSANRNESFHNLTTKGLQRTTGIAQSIAEKPGSHTVRKSRHGQAKPGVLPARTHSGNHIAAGQRSEKFRNVCGIILPVAVKSDNDCARRPFQAEEERGGLTVVRSKMERPRFRPTLCRFIEPPSCGVMASIVDDDDFVSISDGVTDGAKLPSK